MNKIQTELSQRLANLLGYETVERIGSRCTGKYKGTIDYSLVFDGKTCLFLTNGLTCFSERIREYIQAVEIFQKNKKHMFQTICQQIEKDNITAKKEGLLPVKVISLDMCKISTVYFCWPYVRMEVDRRQFDFVETGLCFAIFRNNLEAHFSRLNNRSTYAAGAVNKPTFVFTNVQYSHLDNSYKIEYFE